MRPSLGLLLLAATPVFLSAQGNGDPKTDLDKIAASIKNGKAGDAEKQSAAAAKKHENEEVMNLFKFRKKKGYGIGPAAKPVAPDGIEKALLDIEKGALKPATVFAEAAAFEEMAWRTAAIAETTKAAAPQIKQGKKNPADWRKWSDDLRQASQDLQAAIAAKNGAKLTAAATKANASCANCHSVYR